MVDRRVREKKESAVREREDGEGRKKRDLSRLRGATYVMGLGGWPAPSRYSRRRVDKSD
jgi:hypothetical protein